MLLAWLVSIACGIGITSFAVLVLNGRQQARDNDVDLEKAKIEDGIDTIIDWFPTEAANISTHREQIIQHLLTGSEPHPDSPLLDIVFSGPAQGVSMDAITSLQDQGKCLLNVGFVVYDVVDFVMAIRSMLPKETTVVGFCGWLQTAPRRALNSIKNAIKEFRGKDTGARLSPKEFMELCRVLLKGGAIQAFWHIAQGSMTWWLWVKTAVTMIARLVLWLESAGASFMAEIALRLVGAVQLIMDCTGVYNACFAEVGALSNSTFLMMKSSYV